MWNWFNCYLSGRHEFGVSCEPGAIFLKCSHCGRRSNHARRHGDREPHEIGFGQAARAALRRSSRKLTPSALVF